MSLAVTTAVNATMISSNASNMAALNARKSACKETINNYEGQNATVQEARQYASCVQLVYPQSNMSPDQVLATKAAIILIFLGFAVGAIACRDEGLIQAFFGAIFGALTSALLCLLIGLLVIGVSFLVTA